MNQQLDCGSATTGLKIQQFTDSQKNVTIVTTKKVIAAHCLTVY